MHARYRNTVARTSRGRDAGSAYAYAYAVRAGLEV